MEKRTSCTPSLLAVLLVVCCCSVPVATAQSSAGFLNIDCGATTNYVDPVTRIQWVPDDSYIPTGTNHQHILPTTDPTFSALTELQSLRAFNDHRAKNCYRLPVIKNTTYLLRASFFYGNYDNAAKPPSFQLSIEATTVENITTSSTGVVYKELLYLSQSNVTYLCLLRDAAKSDTPFVSAISLRPVSQVYEKFNLYIGQRYMSIRTRLNFGGSSLIRYPDDSYDRYWHPEGAMSSYLRSTGTIQALGADTAITSEAFRPPSAVMQTAVTTTGNLSSYYMLSGPGSETYDTAFVLVHFAELNSSATPTSREFYVDVGTGSAPTLINPYNDTGGAFERTSWLYWDRIIGPTTMLTLYPDPASVSGPILNGMELYSVSNMRAVGTIDRDVLAIEDIKATMNLSEWTGDPCLPSPHPWVKCSVVDSVLSPEVIALNLSGYNLTGPISPSFAKLVSLTTLSLDHNALTGPIPDLRPLVLLKTLHLENNDLSGTLPDWLTSLPLRELTVQNNNFSGQIPPGLLTSNSLQFTHCPGNNFVDGGCKETDTSKAKSSNLGAIIGATVGGVAFALIIICVGVFFGLRCYRRQAGNSQQNNHPTARPIALKEIGTGSDGSAKAFTLAALAAATNNFKKEIGRGGFGPVYHGTLPDGREVAVKVADKSNRQGDQEFHNEVAVLSKVHHRNLTALVGYCQEKKKQILVYEYVRNGSLYDQLHGTPKPARPLDWRTRLNIALNAAQGLDYLHSSCTPSIIHRDVKSGNILLTGPEYPEVAKVADFGLSRTGPLQDKTHVSTLVRGTAGYLDPQYFDTQQLNLKSDVFSFGVVLLELITGRIPIDPHLVNREEWNLCQYVRGILGAGGDIDQILDPAVRASHPNPEGLWIVAEVALRSVEPKAVHRPTMAEVIHQLRAAIALEIAPRNGSTHNPRRAQAPARHFHQSSSMSSDVLASNVFYESESMPAPR